MSNTNVKGSGVQIVVHSNPAVSLLPANAGVPVVQSTVGGKSTVAGQVAKTSVVITNPA